MKKKRYYYRVSTFALHSVGGGHWEDDIRIDGATPEEAFQEAVEYVKKQGYAFEVKITLCKKNGDAFQ